MSAGAGDEGTAYRQLLGQLHEALKATEELPIETTASRWIGEAQAIVADLIADVPETTVLAERLEHVDRLLEEVDPTDHPVAEDHLRTAIDTVTELLDRLA